jgi:hypothetical protein
MMRISFVGFVVDDLPKNDPVYTDLHFFESAFKGVDADVGEWNVLQFLTGISYALWDPGQSRFRFNADLAAGICKATTPAFTLKFLTPGYMPPIPPAVIEEEPLDISFAYEIGVSGLYKLNDLLGIVGRLDFFGSTAKGEYYGKRNCHLNSINLTFGLNVNF